MTQVSQFTHEKFLAMIRAAERKNKEIIEEVELNQRNADEAAIASNKVWIDVINEIRCPGESKAFASDPGTITGEKTQILNP